MKLDARVSLMLIAAVLVVGSGPSSALAQPWAPWQIKAPAPEGEEEVFGTAAAGKIYLMGAIEDPGWIPMGLVSEYDPATNAWLVKNRMPLPVHHAGVASLEGKIYVVGGFVKPPGPPAWNPVDNVWEYDPESDSWTALAALPTPRGSVACAAHDGKIHCVGGVKLPEWSEANGIGPGTEIVNLTDHLVYDPVADSWDSRAPIPTPRNHTTLTAVGGKLYAIGGRVGHVFVSGWSVATNANEEYDPVLDRWRPRSPMPTPRSAHGAVVVNDRIHVIGGEEYAGYHGHALVVHRTHEVYDPAGNTWVPHVPMRTPRHGYVLAAVDNRIFAISGANISGGGGPRVALTDNEMLVVD